MRFNRTTFFDGYREFYGKLNNEGLIEAQVADALRTASMAEKGTTITIKILSPNQPSEVKQKKCGTT